MTTGPPEEHQPEEGEPDREQPEGSVDDGTDDEPFGVDGPEDADGDPEDIGGHEAEHYTALPSRVEAWRKRSATGAILTGFALGLQDALEPKRDKPQIMVQTSGDPPADLPVEAEFEFRRPRHSVVSIRPWLLRRDGEDAAPPPESASDDREGRN